jgi:DNA-binding MarR family transcriptional regulator
MAVVGAAEEAFDRLRRIAFEGEQAEKMAALGARTKLSPGVIKTLVRLARTHGLASREPDPVDRRVKIVVLTEKGRTLAEEIHAVLSVPPAAFSALSRTEVRQLRELLDKVVAADPALSGVTLPRLAGLR